MEKKYPQYQLTHFIAMYDNVISIASHALNAIVFEGQEYVISILKEIDELEKKKEHQLIINYMNECGWTREDEKSIQRIRKKLLDVLQLEG